MVCKITNKRTYNQCIFIFLCFNVIGSILAKNARRGIYLEEGSIDDDFPKLNWGAEQESETSINSRVGDRGNSVNEEEDKDSTNFQLLSLAWLNRRIINVMKTTRKYISEEDDIHTAIPLIPWGQPLTTTEFGRETTTLAPTEVSTSHIGTTKELTACGLGPIPNYEQFITQPVLIEEAARAKREVPLENVEIPVIPAEDGLIRGIVTIPEAWPWMVAIYLKGQSDSDSSTFWCGGSIIDEDTILSAAHCFRTRDASKYDVRVGDYVLTSDDDGRNPVEHGVKQIIIHENYTEGLYYNDIAVLKLNTKILYNEHASPVCLPPKQESDVAPVNSIASVIGWGDTQFAGRLSDILQQITVPIISNEECAKRYRKIPSYANIFPQGLSRNFICTDFGTKRQDACNGDSGGPMMNYDVGWQIVGIVSFGVGCSKEGFAGVYTRVSHHLDWLESHMK